MAQAEDAAAQASDDPRAAIIVTAAVGNNGLDDALILERRDITVAGSPDLLAALQRNFAGVSLQDAQNNPWQPNLVYRGHVASPLVGQAQGLAAYLDGARFNQPFGDTVNFELIPDAAIRSITLRDASPVYSLNTLGGALVIETETGRSMQGVEGSGALGSYGERDLSLAASDAIGGFSWFGAVQYREEDGWRDFSPSNLLNGFVDLGFDGARAGVHVKFVGADTDLTGNGVAPIGLLAARRRSVFTWPDNQRNRYGRVSLHPWLAVGDAVRFEATLYGQRRKAALVNGDAADIEECEDDPVLAGLLCLETVGPEDEELRTPLTDGRCNRIADRLGGGAYGVFNRGTIASRSEGFLAQVITEQGLGTRSNRLVLGASYDSSENDFAASTELGALTEDRSVTGLGVIIDRADNAIAPVALGTRARFWGLFLSDSLPLTETLTAEIGLRWNHARLILADRIGTALNGDHSFSRLNPGIELDWAVTPHFTLRAGYAEPNRVPTEAELSFLRGRECAVQPHQLLHRRPAARTGRRADLRARRLGAASGRGLGHRLAALGLPGEQQQRHPIRRGEHARARLLREHRQDPAAGDRGEPARPARRMAGGGELCLHRCDVPHAAGARQPGEPRGGCGREDRRRPRRPAVGPAASQRDAHRRLRGPVRRARLCAGRGLDRALGPVSRRG